MDIQHLVDRLEELIDEGRHMPFSKFTMIDEERALEIIDQMRISIPEEIEKAARVLAQRDRILAQANEEAARLVQLARERGEALIDREATVQAASSRAANIVEAARQEAEELTREADQYIMDQFAAMEAQLSRMIAIARASINQVASTDKTASANPAGTPVQASQFTRATVDAPRKEASAD
jgi:hypothetical protein